VLSIETESASSYPFVSWSVSGLMSPLLFCPQWVAVLKFKLMWKKYTCAKQQMFFVVITVDSIVYLLFFVVETDFSLVDLFHFLLFQSFLL